MSQRTSWAAGCFLSCILVFQSLGHGFLVHWYTSVYVPAAYTSSSFRNLTLTPMISSFLLRPRSVSLTALALSGVGLLAACASVPCTCKVCASSLFLAGSCGHEFSVTQSASEVLNRVEWHRRNLQHLLEGSRQKCTRVDWMLKFSAVFPAFRRWCRSASE